MSEANHPTTDMITPDGDVVEVDTEIAPFIARLWKLEMMTFNSCHYNFGYVWVELIPDDLARLLTIVAGCDDGFLNERARDPFCLSPQDREQLVSKYGMPLDYWLTAVDTYWHDDAPGVGLTVSLRFPRDQLAQVEGALAGGEA